MVNISEDVLPNAAIPTRITRSSCSNCLSFRPQKCSTITFQRSYFTISLVLQVCGLSSSKRKTTKYIIKYIQEITERICTIRKPCIVALTREDARTWKSLCLKGIDNKNILCSFKRAFKITNNAFYRFFNVLLLLLLSSCLPRIPTSRKCFSVGSSNFKLH